MLVYIIKGIDSQGNIREIHSHGKEILNNQKILLDQGFSILCVSSRLSFVKKGISPRDLLLFIQSLGILLNSGLDLQKSLQSTMENTSSKGLINFINNIILELKNGKSFSNIISEKKWGIPNIVVGLIFVGESTGKLNSVLTKLSIFLERSQKVKSKLRVAMAYPILISILLVVFTVVFLNVILPGFSNMFSSMGDDFSILIEQRESLLRIIITIILSVLIISLIILFLLDKTMLAKIILKSPIIGNIILDFQCLKLLFALEILTGSNISIEKSLNYAYSVLDNRYLILELKKIREKVICGDLLSTAFSSTIFPKRLSTYISLGEKTGNINGILMELSEYYQSKTGNSIAIFMALIDPLLTIFIGIILFVIILLFIFPLLTSMGGLI